jgi:hypothetical protein
VFREIFTPANAPTPNNNPTPNINPTPIELPGVVIDTRIADCAAYDQDCHDGDDSLTSSSPTVQTISQDEVRSNISDRTGSDAGGFEFDDVTDYPTTDINLEPEPPRSVSSFLRRIFSGNTTSELDIADPPSGANSRTAVVYNNIHITPHVTDDDGDAPTKDPEPPEDTTPPEAPTPTKDTTPTKGSTGYTTPTKDTTPTK